MLHINCRKPRGGGASGSPELHLNQTHFPRFAEVTVCAGKQENYIPIIQFDSSICQPVKADCIERLEYSSKITMGVSLPPKVIKLQYRTEGVREQLCVPSQAHPI